jgi:hypothetical protein
MMAFATCSSPRALLGASDAHLVDENLQLGRLFRDLPDGSGDLIDLRLPII